MRACGRRRGLSYPTRLVTTRSNLQVAPPLPQARWMKVMIARHGGHRRPKHEAIFYEAKSSTWFRRPSLQFHEGLFFALYTFSRSKRTLKRAPRSKFRVSVRVSYSDTASRGPCGISCARRCKIEPPLYTDFTPAVRTSASRRSRQRAASGYPGQTQSPAEAWRRFQEEFGWALAC